MVDGNGVHFPEEPDPLRRISSTGPLGQASEAGESSAIENVAPTPSYQDDTEILAEIQRKLAEATRIWVDRGTRSIETVRESGQKWP